MVGTLLDAGADVNLRVNMGGDFPTSPLQYAVTLGDSAMAEYLIRRGADPNEIDSRGFSMLGYAAQFPDADTLATLLARGAKLHFVDEHGMTALHHAASNDYGHTAVVEKLIAAGADLKAKNKDGLTALDLAKKYGHSAIANVLADKAGR